MIYANGRMVIISANTVRMLIKMTARVNKASAVAVNLWHNFSYSQLRPTCRPSLSCGKDLCLVPSLMDMANVVLLSLTPTLC